ncbi:hypothetical protein [Flavobacterium sp.]|jgi:hypothetical protein|uniref:hypothetical protein n=1 Tax=Flavobacterium sp. TaxID=239 RepID=UPI0037BE5D4B
MKKILLLVTLAIGMVACSTDEVPTPTTQLVYCNCYKVLEYNDYTYNWNTGQGSSTGWYFVLNVVNSTSTDCTTNGVILPLQTYTNTNNTLTRYSRHRTVCN